MPELIEAMRFNTVNAELDALLPTFSRLLKAVSIVHRLAEDKGELVLWVYHVEHITVAKDIFQGLERGEIDVEKTLSQQKKAKRRFHWSELLAYPLTVVISLSCVLGFLSLWLESWQLISVLSFQGLHVDNNVLVVNTQSQVFALFKQGQLWRLITPIFLHFSLMHIAFNLVLFSFFARQIEVKEGGVNLGSDILLLALISNLSQFYAMSDQLFGGISGVVYGLMAYCWMVNVLQKKHLYQVPQGLMLISLFMMGMGFIGVFNIFGIAVANWAHVSGLVGGIVLAFMRYSSWQLMKRQ